MRGRLTAHAHTRLPAAIFSTAPFFLDVSLIQIIYGALCSIRVIEYSNLNITFNNVTNNGFRYNILEFRVIVLKFRCVYMLTEGGQL
jgi:hypothetical protein